MTVCGKQGPKHKEYHLHGYKGGSPCAWMPAYRAQGNSLLGVSKFPDNSHEDSTEILRITISIRSEEHLGAM